MSPFEVDYIVNEAEEDDHADGEDWCVILNQLIFRETESYLLLDRDNQKYDWDDDSESFGPILSKKSLLNMTAIIYRKMCIWT